MTTFLAIIFGTASAGILGTLLAERAGAAQEPTRLWIGSALCMVIAVVGTATALMIRSTPRAEPNLQLRWSSLWAPPETRAVLYRNRPLLAALLVSSLFWLIGGVALPSVNSLGKVQLGLNDLLTSLLTAVIGVGIAAGAILAGRLSRHGADFRVTRAGAWGLVICLSILAVYLPGGRHLLGFGGSAIVLTLLGISAGLFAVPVQVFIQIRPPEKQKGRMIAVMNIVNFVAIFLAGPIYKLFDIIVTRAAMPRSMLFALAAMLIFPVALLYRPKVDTR